MKVFRKGKRLLMLLIICLLTLGQAATVQADETKDGSIEIQYAVKGVKFDLYRIKGIDGEGNRDWIGKFENSQVNMEETAAAETLKTYILQYNALNEEKITPDQTGIIDENGKLTFTSLPKGTYLVIGEATDVDMDGVKHTYTPSAVLISDEMVKSGKSWTVRAVLKYSDKETPSEETPSGGEATIENPTVQDPLPVTTTVSVTKVWSDDDASTRPTSVNAQLLCDSEIYDTVTLSAENNWTYQWTDLDSTHSWRVAEENVPDGYEVSIESEENDYIITNTSDTVFDEPTTTDVVTSGKNNPGTDTDPADPNGSGTTTTDKVNAPQTTGGLPKTGQLWWPVALLGGAGLLLLAAGLVRRKRTETGRK